MKINAFDDVCKGRLKSAAEAVWLFAQAIRRQKMHSDFEASPTAGDLFKFWARLWQALYLIRVKGLCVSREDFTLATGENT